MKKMCTMVLNDSLNGVELKFENKPTEKVLELIKENGFCWSPKKKIWYAKQNEKTLSVAKQVSEEKVSFKEAKKQVKESFNLWAITHADIKPLTKQEIISIGEVKEIAKRIRQDLKQFKGFKFSVKSNGTYLTSKISIYIKSSPLEKDSIYLEMVRKQVQKIADSYCYCTDYNSYGDYGSSYNIYTWVSVDYDYIQTEGDFSSVLKEYDEQEKEAKIKEYEEQQKRYREWEKEEEIKKAEYEKKEKERQEKTETIENNVSIVDLKTPYFIKNGKWANCNKNESIETYKKNVSNNDYYIRTAKITREIFFNKETYDLFCNMLLDEFSFLQGFGGSDTLDNRINSMEDYNNMTEEERKTVEWFSTNCIVVYCEKNPMFIIDTQGYSYSRYVGLIDEDAIIEKEYITKQIVSATDIDEYIKQAIEIKNLHIETIQKNDIEDTWTTESFNLYKKQIVKSIKDMGLTFNKNVIQQINDINLKSVMYRILKEPELLQAQFTESNLKDGDNITIVHINDMGFMTSQIMKYIKHENITYAQYKDAIKLYVNLSNKKGTYTKVLYRDVLIYKGDVQIPETLICNNNLFSCDKKQYETIINHLKAKNIFPIINTYKPVF